MLEPSTLGDLILEVVEVSDSIYAANGGEPSETSDARLEVDEYDDALAEQTRSPGPVFGAYVDAEGKLRSLNDLARSGAIVLHYSGTSVGYATLMRAAIETAARLYWILAPSGDHNDRAARFMSERLRTVSEVSKFDDEARAEMKAFEREIREGAASAGLDVPGPPPPAIDLIVELLSQHGALTLDGMSRAEIGTMFYRLPSARAHAAMHSSAIHHQDPRADPDRRMTKPGPWEQTLLLTSGWFSGYATAHRALLVLYGWDSRRWDTAATEVAERLVAALGAERARAAGSTDWGDAL